MRGGLPLTAHLVQFSLFCLSSVLSPEALSTEMKHPNHSISMLLTSAQAQGFCTDHGDLGRMLWNPSRGPLELRVGASSHSDSSEETKIPEEDGPVSPGLELQ